MKFNFDFIYRKKKFDQTTLESTSLSRCLNIFDLTALGVSATLGSGVYVLIGTIMATYTGPSIIISFLFAGICSFLAGLCYAELGARVPRSGSAYIYIYVTIGEFFAFIIGWTVILEYVIGTSSIASALSKYIDNLADFKISKAFRNAMPINVSWLAPYPDFLAFGFTVIITIFLTIGVKESSFLNKIFTIVNLSVIIFIIICGATQADSSYWDIDVYPTYNYTDIEGNNVTCGNTKRCGYGGFMPFGFSGLLQGAAKCFYAYIGFDVIATAGEEVIDPKRTIPMSILITLIIVSICYMSASTVISLMVPYFVFDENSLISDAFKYVNLDWAAIVVSVGAIISLVTCLYGSMFPMPRIVYSMSSDGLLFNSFSYILPRLNTPIISCLFTGLLSGFLVLIFDLNQLIDMASIGTLLAFALVSLSTLILRYRPDENQNRPISTRKTILSYFIGVSDEPFLKRVFSPSTTPTEASSCLVDTITIILGLDIMLISILTNVADITKVVTFVFVIIYVVILIFFVFIIWLQPQNKNITTFKVPFMPFFPILSAFVNIFLMTSLNSATWIRFIIWFVIGVIIYFFYGIRFSKENTRGSKAFFPCLQKEYEIMEEPVITHNESNL